MTQARQGHLFIISGPSGAGKGTLVKELLSRVPDTWFSVSATTRPMRPGEVDGKSYYFLTQEEFETLIREDGLLEYSQHFSNYYGTPKGPVLERIKEGYQVILEIDVKGAAQVKEKIPEAILIFIEPPSLDELKRRLIKRGTETAQQFDARIHRVKNEMDQKTRYNHVLVNDDLDLACNELADVINAYAEKK